MDDKHFIQRYILDMLMKHQYARFRDLRPPRIDSNAFSYHLTTLTKQNLVTKTDHGYTLTTPGLAYVDSLSSSDTRPRPQPQIRTIIVLINEFGEAIVQRKERQPFINQLTFPSGKLHLDDKTIGEAAVREVYEKTGLHVANLTHAGDLYIAITTGGEVMMNALMHVFTKQVVSTISLEDGVFWQSLSSLEGAAPATRKIAELLQNRHTQERFFCEFAEEL